MQTRKIQILNSAISTDTTLTQSGVPADAKIVGDALAEKQPVGDYALKSDITEAPVQSVNGKVGTVVLTPEDIGAQVSGDYLTAETDPTVPAWAKASTKPSYTASEVGADAKGTASSAVSSHNTATDAHNDIRDLIEGLTTRLNALADSDDTTLDQMSEIVAYIKSNKTLIEDITTNKVNVSDIINNLTTNVTNKPLSAAQGVALKALIDAIEVPTNVSAFTNDAGYLTSYTETDPTVPAWAKAATKPTYIASEVGADPAGTAQAAVDALNIKNGDGEYSVVAGEGTYNTVPREFVIGSYNTDDLKQYSIQREYLSDDVVSRTFTYDNCYEFFPVLDKASGIFDFSNSNSLGTIPARQLYSKYYDGVYQRISDTECVLLYYDGNSDDDGYIIGRTKSKITSTTIPCALIIGNGTSDSARSNAHTTDFSGNAWYAGILKIGGASVNDSAAKEVATKEYVETYVNETILGGEW